MRYRSSTRPSRAWRPWLSFTAVIALLAVAFVGSGAAQFVHNELDHVVRAHADHTHPAATPSTSGASHAPVDQPSDPQAPAEHESCATCLTLHALRGVTLDLLPVTPAFDTPVQRLVQRKIATPGGSDSQPICPRGPPVLL